MLAEPLIAPVGTEDRAVPASEAGPMLTQRERETLELLARGFSCAEIARLQLVSVHTTRCHVKSLYGKLGVHSKNEAVFEATAMGLLQPASWVRPVTGARPRPSFDAAGRAVG